MGFGRQAMSLSFANVLNIVNHCTQQLHNILNDYWLSIINSTIVSQSPNKSILAMSESMFFDPISIHILLAHGVPMVPAGWSSHYPHGKTQRQMLVGGWPTPLKNMKVNWDDEIPNIWKYKSHVPNHQPEWQCSIVVFIHQRVSVSRDSRRKWEINVHKLLLLTWMTMRFEKSRAVTSNNLYHQSVFKKKQAWTFQTQSWFRWGFYRESYSIWRIWRLSIYSDSFLQI